LKIKIGSLLPVPEAFMTKITHALLDRHANDCR